MKSRFLRIQFMLLLLVYPLFFAHAQDNSGCGTPGGCDTIGVEKKVSPWRVGGFIGPAVAFCGSWENTFNSNKYRDKSLFNGIGFNAAMNADYFFRNKKNPTSRVQFGLGAVAGLQNFFLRKDLDTFLDQIIAQSGVSQAEIRKGSSEDHYLVAGPVLNFNFTKKPRSPFLEASVRGGIFRTTPAAIFVYERTTGNNIYSVTATDKRYHAGLLATLGFFVPSKNGLWAWGVEAMGFRTKVDYVFPGATIYPFERKHGGFSAGIAMRRNFVKNVIVAKAPSSVICAAPSLELKMGDESIKGKVFNLDGASTDNGAIKMTWSSLAPADTSATETFTAKIHRIYNGSDEIIAKVICQEGNELEFPNEFIQNGKPMEGQYYATVQSSRISSCASCMSDASTTGFTALKPIVDTVTVTPCFTECNLQFYGYQLKKKSGTKYVPSDTCEGCLCPVDGVKTYSQYNGLGKVAIPDCDATTLDINQVLENAANNIKRPSWLRTIYVSVESIVAGEKCNTAQGITKTNYKATVRKGVVGKFFKVK